MGTFIFGQNIDIWSKFPSSITIATFNKAIQGICFLNREACLYKQKSAQKLTFKNLNAYLIFYCILFLQTLGGVMLLLIIGEASFGRPWGFDLGFS